MVAVAISPCSSLLSCTVLFDPASICCFRKKKIPQDRVERGCRADDELGCSEGSLSNSTACNKRDGVCKLRSGHLGKSLRLRVGGDSRESHLGLAGLYGTKNAWQARAKAQVDHDKKKGYRLHRLHEFLVSSGYAMPGFGGQLALQR